MTLCRCCGEPMAPGTERPPSGGNPNQCVPCATGINLPPATAPAARNSRDAGSATTGRRQSLSQRQMDDTMKTKPNQTKQTAAGIGLLAAGLLGGVLAIVVAIGLGLAVYEVHHLIHPTPLGTNAQGHVIFRVDAPRTVIHHILPAALVPVHVPDINGETVQEQGPGRSE